MKMNQRKTKETLLKTALKAVWHAGLEILKVYRGENIEIEFKQDNSPLTVADKAANEIIIKQLNSTQIPVISEESKIPSFQERKNWDYCWIIDPLDGTKEFIKRNGQFTVNLALIHKGIPILGVVLAPALDLLYFSSNNRAFIYNINKQIIDFQDLWKDILNHKKQLPINNERKNYIVLASKSHQNTETAAYIKKLKTKYQNIEIFSIGSSLKFCMIAEGKADLYPRFSNIMEWDTAAGHAIIKAAGGEVINPETGLPLTYNKENLTNPWFIASL